MNKARRCRHCGGNLIWDVDEKRLQCMMCGRPQTGSLTNCVDCGEGLYIKKYRLEEGKAYRCRKCASISASKQPRKAVNTLEGAELMGEKHNENQSQEEKPQKTRKYLKPEIGVNDFCLIVTEGDFVKLNDEDFIELWTLLGQVIMNRIV